MPLSWAMSCYDRKLRKLRKFQKWLAWSPLSGYVTKSLLWSQLDVKKASLEKRVPKHIVNELMQQNWDELRGLVYTKKLVSLIRITSHNSVWVSDTEKKCWFFQGFELMTNFATTQVISHLNFFITFKKYIKRTTYEKIAFWKVTVGVWQIKTWNVEWLDLVFWDILPMGELTTNIKVCFHIKIKNAKIFFYEIFWNLTSQKKSQLISAVCLHFFKNNEKSKWFIPLSQNRITVWKIMLFVYIFVLLHKSAHLLEKWDISLWVDELQRWRYVLTSR